MISHWRTVVNGLLFLTGMAGVLYAIFFAYAAPVLLLPCAMLTAIPLFWGDGDDMVELTRAAHSGRVAKTTDPVTGQPLAAYDTAREKWILEGDWSAFHDMLLALEPSTTPTLAIEPTADLVAWRTQQDAGCYKCAEPDLLCARHDEARFVYEAYNKQLSHNLGRGLTASTGPR